VVTYTRHHNADMELYDTGACSSKDSNLFDGI